MTQKTARISARILPGSEVPAFFPRPKGEKKKRATKLPSFFSPKQRPGAKSGQRRPKNGTHPDAAMALAVAPAMRAR